MQAPRAAVVGDARIELDDETRARRRRDAELAVEVRREIERLRELEVLRLARADLRHRLERNDLAVIGRSGTRADDVQRALEDDHRVRIERDALGTRLDGAAEARRERARSITEDAQVGDRAEQLVDVFAARRVAASRRRQEEEALVETALAGDLRLAGR